MQKNPINEGDSIQEPMTLQDYEDAVSLPDGIYPITDDAGTVLDASIIAYGNETVEDALNSANDDITKSKYNNISATVVSYTTTDTATYHTLNGDGYIVAKGSGSLYLFGANASGNLMVEGSTCIYARKGMKLRLRTTGYTTVEFYELTS